MNRRHSEPGPRRAADASMTLINETYRRPLDPGYQEVADRRRAGTAPRRTVRGGAALLVLAVALGAFATSAATALRRPPPAVLEARALLETEIRERIDRAELLRDANALLAAEVTGLQTAAASSEDPALLAQLQQDAVPGGRVPVVGPGLQIVLTDWVPGPGEQENPDNRVQDVDLQLLANGLWAAGAEAIAINGARLTSTTAIRSAGAAVLVDLRPLGSPYTVEAIGDAAGLQTGLARGVAGQRLASLRQQFRIGVEVTPEKDLELPAAGSATLRSARVLGDAGATGTVPDPTARSTAGAAARGSAADALGPVLRDVAVSSGPDGGERS
ncbi:DUF881 domain-containing protein [Cellulomonas shaoxiangyii]|uniref:DUF881 domain-containing protein n=1 Tax=Cellulomonas shaoxiangyii TaxID=2566013 RepID=A0A4P7SIV1_9CELL|nr:DUF881 domain-containing protein [Cellulomonas shaoxiangyii]QCB93588.1 DUF881 domain-containing protein [Cellulomonas shaoxiangyii]TGY85707.1 DUF881 domain-containing protein [Cellulomonas shaoxiangyii]